MTAGNDCKISPRGSLADDFYRLYGGTTRTALALLDFDIGSALTVNPLATIVAVAFIIGGGLALIWVLVRGPVPTLKLSWSRRFTGAVVGIVLINWIYLILTD